MRRRGADEAGDSLVEIVLALVIIGVVVGAFVATFSTGATASSAHRNLVTADAVLRNYAEATKLASRSCTAGAPLAVSPPALPAGFTVASNPLNPTCPDPKSKTVTTVTLTVTMPSSDKKSVSVEVRTP